jgi:hypothetical protein
MDPDAMLDRAVDDARNHVKRKAHRIDEREGARRRRFRNRRRRPAGAARR